MSKKKHRDKKRDVENSYNINPQILELLKGSNLDISKISSLMAAMNQDGFDINSISNLIQNNTFQGNNGNNGTNGNNIDFNKISSMLNNMDNGNLDFSRFHEVKSNEREILDENIEMLLIIKSVVNAKKAKFLERVIQMYKDGQIIY